MAAHYNYMVKPADITAGKQTARHLSNNKQKPSHQPPFFPSQIQSEYNVFDPPPSNFFLYLEIKKQSSGKRCPSNTLDSRHEVTISADWALNIKLFSSSKRRMKDTVQFNKHCDWMTVSTLGCPPFNI